MVPTLVLVSLLVFLVFQQLADPAVLDLNSNATPEQIARHRHKLGLDQSLPARAWQELRALFSLDFGTSRYHQQAVAPLIARSLPVTLLYALPGFIGATALSIATALFCARHEGQRIDRILQFLSTALVSCSSLLIVIAVHTGLTHLVPLFPISWPLGASDRWLELRSLVLPSFLWVLLQFGPDLRHYRSLFIQDLKQAHFDALRARGLPESVVLKHQLRAIAAPLCARIGHLFPHVFAGSVVIEYMFNIPGVGALLVDAIQGVDLPLMQAITFVLTVSTLFAQLSAEIAAGLLDPRMRRW